MRPDDYIRAARMRSDFPAFIRAPWNGQRVRTGTQAAIAGCNSFYVLCAHNMAGLHRIDDRGFGGDVVMEDSPRELRKHLPIWLHGSGRILKTGLGMGCVVRGLLAKPEVEHIDVIEIDPNIIDIFGAEFISNPRVTIHQGDALSIKLAGRWDYAWHDIWCEGNDGLAVLHTDLIFRFRHQCQIQGAWAYPRTAAKLHPVQLLGAPARR